MPTKITTDTPYQKLLSNLKNILIQGLRIIEEQRVKTYWQTGELISEHLLENRQHGDGLFIRLSEDLGIGQRNLERSVQFYREFPNASSMTQLDWTHYIVLLGVQEKSERLFLEKRAITQDWTVKQLKEAIRIKRLKQEKSEEEGNGTAPPELRLVRGRLFNYKLIKSDYLNLGQSELLVDCGFSFWKDLTLLGISDPGEGDIVESKKSNNHYSFTYSSAKKNQLYTYKAFVERVVDADTIWAQIDLGFYSHTRQKLRLRGIDAPELSTQKGLRAKEFVEATLSEVPFIIIKSRSLDKYGRPLSDIFYLEGEDNPQVVLEQGVFLNQELLDRGLAERESG